MDAIIRQWVVALVRSIVWIKQSFQLRDHWHVTGVAIAAGAHVMSLTANRARVTIRLTCGASRRGSFRPCRYCHDTDAALRRRRLCQVSSASHQLCVRMYDWTSPCGFVHAATSVWIQQLRMQTACGHGPVSRMCGKLEREKGDHDAGHRSWRCVVSYGIVFDAGVALLVMVFTRCRCWRLWSVSSLLLVAFWL